MEKQQPSEIIKPSFGWIRSFTQSEENLPTVLPKSKTGRLALRAKLANIEAEKAIATAYQVELSRTKAVGEAMFKSGRALRLTLASSGRQIVLRVAAARRRLEPGYRDKSEVN